MIETDLTDENYQIVNGVKYYIENDEKVYVLMNDANAYVFQGHLYGRDIEQWIEDTDKYAEEQSYYNDRW